MANYYVISLELGPKSLRCRFSLLRPHRDVFDGQDVS